MNFALKRSIKAFAVTLALSGTLIGGSVALANTGTGTINGNTIGAAVEKSSASGSDAHITLNTMLYYHETVSVNILNKNDNYVNKETVDFCDTHVGAKKDIPYKDGKGVKGNMFRPAFIIRPASTVYTSDIKYSFTP